MQDLRTLAIFVKVAERLSFMRAAVDLGITQSGVSNAISRLEEQIGTRLLARTTRRVSLTEDGAAFASCSDTVAVAQGATATPACGLRGQVWSGWFASHTRNFFTWADAHFEATMNSARDITRLQHELDQQQNA